MVAERLLLSIIPVAAVACLGGCCSNGHKPMVVAEVGHPHAIFNPDYSPAPPAINDREDWPATYTAGADAELTLYDVHFVDIHERGLGNDGGYLFRRFESNSYGRRRR